MIKIKEFVQLLAAIIVATGIMAGFSVSAYSMLSDDLKIATRGWVMSTFGTDHAVQTLINAKKSINYHEKRKCQHFSLRDIEHAELAWAYTAFFKYAEYNHWYMDMTRTEICIDRGVL